MIFQQIAKALFFCGRILKSHTDLSHLTAMAHLSSVLTCTWFAYTTSHFHITVISILPSPSGLVLNFSESVYVEKQTKPHLISAHSTDPFNLLPSVYILVVGQVVYTGFNELGLDAAIHGETDQSMKGLLRLSQ